MFRLKENICWCDDRGHAIFLDIDSDRYFALPFGANDAFLRLARGELPAGDTDQLEPLFASGILVETADTFAIPRPPSCEPPTSDYCDHRRSRSDTGSFVRQLVLELGIERDLRRKGFAEVIAATRSALARWRTPPRQADARLFAIAGAARSVSHVLRAHDRCLVRALAVYHICLRCGLRPKLVFGVVAHPFAAHCWVQLGNAAIVGGFEQARLYTPILVIE